MLTLSSLARRCARLLLVLLIAVTITGCAFRKHIDQGDMYFGQGQYEQALAEYEAALRIDPGAEEAVIKARRAREKLAGEWTGQANAKLEAGDFQGAIVTAGKAYDLTPENAEIHALITSVATASADHADSLIPTHQFGEGIALYAAMDETLPEEHARVSGRHEAFKKAWANHLSEQAALAEEKGRHGEALLLWGKAAQLSTDPRFKEKRNELRDELREVYAYRVALKGSKKDALFQRFVPRLLSLSIPQNIYALEPGDDERAHAAYTIEIGEPKFRENVTTSQKTEQYVARTQKVPNPDYKDLTERIDQSLDEVERQRQLVAQAQRDLTRAEEAARNEDPNDGITSEPERVLQEQIDAFNAQQEQLTQAEQELKAAEEKRQATPRQIDEPVYADHTYTVTTHTLNANIPVRGEIIHKDDRKAITFLEVPSVSYSDTKHDAQRVLNLAADPLELPSRDAITSDLQGKAFETITAKMLESFSNYRAALLTRAFASPDDVKTDILALYILLDPSTVDASVPSEIERLHDITDPVEVLTAP